MSEAPRNRILLGIDPGFSSIGVAALTLAARDPTAMRVDAFEVFHTEKDTRKGTVFTVEDNLRRCREIAAYLDALVDRFTNDKNVVVALCCEAMSFPRSSIVAAKVAMTWGVLAAVSHRTQLPILQATPQAVKKGIGLPKKSFKEDVWRAMDARFPTVAKLATSINKSDREHPYDALAVAIVCRESDLVRLARFS